jgi:hypothetical protein
MRVGIMRQAVGADHAQRMLHDPPHLGLLHLEHDGPGRQQLLGPIEFADAMSRIHSVLDPNAKDRAKNAGRALRNGRRSHSSLPNIRKARVRMSMLIWWRGFVTGR